MKYLILIILFNTLVTIKVFAQNGQDVNPASFLDFQFFEQDDYNSAYGNLALEDIKGSPFLDEEFKESKIYFVENNNTIKEIALRFNLIEGTFEFQKNDKIFLLPFSDKISYVEYFNDKFKIVSYKDQKSFVKVLVEGKTNLYILQKSYFSPAEKSDNQYERSKPAEFHKVKDVLLLEMNDSKIGAVSNKKDFYNIFGKDLVKDFMKKENNNLKDVEDYILFLNEWNNR